MRRGLLVPLDRGKSVGGEPFNRRRTGLPNQMSFDRLRPNGEARVKLRGGAGLAGLRADAG